MGTTEGLRGLLDLVSIEEVRALQRVADIDEANALLERYASTVAVLTNDVTIAKNAMAAAYAARDQATTQFDRMVGLRVQELVDMTARAEASEVECDQLRTHTASEPERTAVAVGAALKKGFSIARRYRDEGDARLALEDAIAATGGAQ